MIKFVKTVKIANLLLCRHDIIKPDKLPPPESFFIVYNDLPFNLNYI